MEPRPLPRGSKTIRLPFDMETYPTLLNNVEKFRSHLDDWIEKSPELFPQKISEGYELHGFTDPSLKLNIRQRRIKIKGTNDVFNICPSAIMPYMTGFTSDVEKPLFLQRFGLPYWSMTYAFGKNDMYWYRMVNGFGRNSIVGTTVKDPERLPKDILADEKHSSRKGEKVYVPLTAGAGCILGAAVSKSAGEIDLTEAYGKFAYEAKNVAPNYNVESVNMDGWKATENAWENNFPDATAIPCFLHAYIGIRDRCKKKDQELFNEVSEEVWDAYRAEDKRTFAQRIRRLREKAEDKIKNATVLKKVLSLCGKSSEFMKAFDHPSAHRTSNMVDRLMRWLDKYLFNMSYFHGKSDSAELGVRAWAILRNFQPYCTRTVGNRTELVCAVTELNGFKYSDNWLENLMIATSMGGYRQ